MAPSWLKLGPQFQLIINLVQVAFELSQVGTEIVRRPTCQEHWKVKMKTMIFDILFGAFEFKMIDTKGKWDLSWPRMAPR